MTLAEVVGLEPFDRGPKSENIEASRLQKTEVNSEHAGVPPSVDDVVLDKLWPENQILVQETLEEFSPM